MLGSANLGLSVYLVFTVILSRVVRLRLLQNLVHVVPQTSIHSPLTIFNRFHIHNKNKHGARIGAQVRMKRFPAGRRTLSVRQA